MTGPIRITDKNFKINLVEMNYCFNFIKTKYTMENYTDQELRDELTRRGYFTGNMWRVEDVTCSYECTPEQSQEVLYESLTNGATMEQVWLSIDISADLRGYSKKK
jgi:hypothetical protein